MWGCLMCQIKSIRVNYAGSSNILKTIWSSLNRTKRYMLSNVQCKGRPQYIHLELWWETLLDITV